MGMNGFLLLIPFFLIRFGLLALLNKKAILRAARFPPCCGKEKIAYWVYQISNVAIFVMLLFLSVPLSISRQAIAGWIGYSVGLLLCTVSVIHFAFPAPNGLNTNGIYRFSRNPMYLSYFIYFLSLCLLTRSWVLFGMVMVFQVSAHWIIRAEERWCLETFGDDYRNYMKQVRRYL